MLKKMKRKITKNNHQYKVSLPIELLRKLKWNHSTEIKFHEVETELGKGLLIIKDKANPLKLRIRK